MDRSNCQHLAWVEFVNARADRHIVDTHRLQRLASQLRDPSSQAPSIALLLGRDTKNRILRDLLPKGSLKKQLGKPTCLNLRADTESLGTDFPKYYADLDPLEQTCELELGHRTGCHVQQDLHVSWQPGSPRALLDIVVSRLLFLFTDVVCLFTDDLGGVEATRKLLVEWTKLARKSHTGSSIRPHVLLIHKEPEDEKKHLEIDNFMVDLNREVDALRIFADIKVIRAYQRNHRQRYDFMKEMTDSFNRARADRMAASMLFVATHQAALFHRGLLNLTRTAETPFNFAEAARQGNEVQTELVAHTETIFKVSQQLPASVVATVIASSTILDAYPKGMHGFDPNFLFRQLYKPKYRSAFSRVWTGSPEDVCNDIQEKFCSLRLEMTTRRVSAAEMHLSTLQSFRQIWSLLKSNTTCLVCLSQSPEHVLVCGHSLCENCTKRFGKESSEISGLYYTYRLCECPICGKRMDYFVRLKPPTASIRILSIDGGGIRGIVPLETLSLLQQLIRSDCPIQELFDLAYGTSIGGIIVLGLFKKRMTVEQLLDFFRTFSQTLFGARCARDESSLIPRALKSLITPNGMYDANLFEETLMTQFGAHCRMFDFEGPEASGTKIAVTAVKVSETSTPTRIFTNYNGVRRRGFESGYRLERPSSTDNEPYIWQVARATSAAPVYFKTVKISQLGTYQDGGVNHHNNPVNIALWESRYIWPSVIRPDVVLSLGTGYEETSQSPVAVTPKVPFPWSFSFSVKDTSLHRLIRSFKSSMDGQSTWRELMNHVREDDKDDYFRLTLELPGPEPAIDDYTSIDLLSSAVRLQPRGPETRRQVLMALLISSFFFELYEVPKLSHNGTYYCDGMIRCRSSGVVKSLLRLHPYGDLEFFCGGTSLGKFVSERDLCGTCHRYGKPVHFYVKSLEDEINLNIKWGIGQTRKLSAMPRRVSWFIDSQGLDMPFGNAVDNDMMACGQCSQHDRELPAATGEPMRLKRKLWQGTNESPQQKRTKRS